MKFDIIKTRKGKLEQKIAAEIVKEHPDVNVIADAIYIFEKDNLESIEKLRKEKKVDTKKISGALKQCIDVHGPITKDFIGSATKRIYGSLLTTNKKPIKPMDIYYKVIHTLFYSYLLYLFIRYIIL